MDDFDFDYWQRLASGDPAVYFRMRAAAIADFIAACPERMRPHLQQTQERIDALRACSGSPLNTTRRMMALMGDSLVNLGKQIGEVRHEVESMGTHRV